MSITAARADFTLIASDVAARVAGEPLKRWEPAFRLTTSAEWFGDPDEKLVVVVGAHEGGRAIDGILGFLLGVMGDGTAHLVLPAGTEAMTLRRMAFLTYPVRVWTHDGVSVSEQIVPTEQQIFDSFDDDLVLDVHDIGHGSAWLAALLSWADEHLEITHRRSYWSWQHQGRQVLQVRQNGKKIVVAAGVQYSKATELGLPEPLELVLVEEATAAEVAAIRQAIDVAIKNRDGGVDVGNQEHRFQGALAKDPSILGYARMEREFPAVRAGRGYLDFLGVTTKGQLVVVETKRGPDNQLALQGLDYWLWATAHRSELATVLDADPKQPVRIDYVLDTTAQPIVSPYTAAQLEALDGSIPWQVRAVSWTSSDDIAVTDLPRRTPPLPTDESPLQVARIAPPRYAARITPHLRAHAPGPTTSADLLTTPTDGIVAAARGTWDDLEARGQLHKYANSLKSSQAFAINLFGPLDSLDVIWLLRRWFPQVITAERPQLEWEDPLDRLGETSGALKNRTQVDVLLRGQTSDRTNVAALVEVKLTEAGFGNCNAYQTADEQHLPACLSPGPFGNLPDQCWSIHNKGTGGRRRYYNLLGDTLRFENAGCDYRTDAYQPMRNLALAEALIASGDIDEAAFVVCAPSARTDLQRTLERFPPGRARWLDAETVLSIHRHAEATDLRRRYDLRPDARDVEVITTRYGGGASVLSRVATIYDQITAGEDGWAELDDLPLSLRIELANLTELATETARASRAALGRAHISGSPDG